MKTKHLFITLALIATTLVSCVKDEPCPEENYFPKKIPLSEVFGQEWKGQRQDNKDIYYFKILNDHFATITVTSRCGHFLVGYKVPFEYNHDTSVFYIIYDGRIEKGFLGLQEPRKIYLNMECEVITLKPFN